MRVLIVGAGAVGQFLAARLTQRGHDVVVMGRPAQADALNALGISLEAGGTRSTAQVRAVAGIDDALLRAPFELVIVAVKSYSTAEAAVTIGDIPGCGNASILTVQNGVGNEDLLAERFGADRVVAGALTVAVDRIDSTALVATAKGGLCIAPVGANPHNWMLAALSSANMPVRAVGDWQSLKWSKLCINILGNAVCAVLDWSPAQVYGDSHAFQAERACLLETIAVMSAQHITPLNLINFPAAWLVRSAQALPAGLLRALLGRRVSSGRGGKLPSLLIDLRARREHSEVVVLNGAVALHAVKNGLSAPANAKLTEVVTGIASGALDWEAWRGKPQALLESIRA